MHDNDDATFWMHLFLRMIMEVLSFIKCTEYCSSEKAMFENVIHVYIYYLKHNNINNDNNEH